ncbi:MAG: hypothetical protein H6737_26560 [Alphaproteobacteria bacterium]|nr:hypothetical protein [Alphaproteobacteria bacterium]
MTGLPPVVLPPSDGIDVHAHLRRICAGPLGGCELRAPADDARWREAAEALGLVDAGIRERWRGVLPGRPADPGFVSLASMGPERFVARLGEALEGVDDPRFGSDPAALFEAWEPLAPGEDGLWGVVGDIGVVVPRRVEPEVGSLLFVGTFPRCRGQGHGPRLHDAALALLGRAGASLYEDEVAERNVPMRRLLQRCGASRVERYRSLLPAG